LTSLTFARRAVYNGPDVITLALDTTTAAGSVAVRRDGRLLAERAGPPGVPHARRLPGEILDLLEGCGVPLLDVSLYAVASGPGAFTGLRIGIATIQGFAFAHGRPVAGISALDALAHAVRGDAAAARLPFVGGWMDAARGEVFAALFSLADGGATITVDEASVGTAKGVLGRWAPLIANRPVLFAGDGAVRYRAQIEGVLGDGASVMARVPALAGVIAALAEGVAAMGGAGPPHAIRPVYVRRPDAELARDRALAAPVSRP
jgi:tRNA threonylcarbamoyladenosine biosynthesis protein TsaB